MDTPAAPMAPIVFIVSAGVVLMMAAFLVAALLWPAVLWGLGLGGALLAVLVVWMALRAPVGYSLVGDTLTVRLRLGRKTVGPVTAVSVLDEPPGTTVRVWGNGGLFGITGLYWSKRLGRYHAWITDPRRTVLVEVADGRKVVISPADPSAWASVRPAA